MSTRIVLLNTSTVSSRKTSTVWVPGMTMSPLLSQFQSLDSLSTVTGTLMSWFAHV